MLPPPSTAPVKAILATLMFELVGLRCRPLMRAEISSLHAPTRSAVGFGLERPPRQRCPPERTAPASPPGSRKRPQSDHGAPVGPPPPSRFGFPRPMDGAR